jgi:hypothetical protein
MFVPLFFQKALIFLGPFAYLITLLGADASPHAAAIEIKDWIIRSILTPSIRRTDPGDFLPWFPAIPADADPLKKKSIPDFGAY